MLHIYVRIYNIQTTIKNVTNNSTAYNKSVKGIRMKHFVF